VQSLIDKLHEIIILYTTRIIVYTLQLTFYVYTHHNYRHTAVNYPFKLIVYDTNKRKLKGNLSFPRGVYRSEYLYVYIYLYYIHSHTNTRFSLSPFIPLFTQYDTVHPHVHPAKDLRSNTGYIMCDCGARAIGIMQTGGQEIIILYICSHAACR